jgi:hypothetical protein
MVPLRRGHGVRGGALPPALLCAALGLALAFAPRRAVTAALLMLTLAALTLSFATVEPRWTEAVFLGCWVSIAVAALAVYLPGGVSTRTAMLLAINTGVSAGAIVAAAGQRSDLALALPCALLALPAGWLVRSGRPIAAKVAASWLLAVAVLAAALPATVTTPGYEATHRE